MTKLEELGYLVEDMKGSVNISYQYHACGWFGQVKSKRGERTWDAHEIIPDPYDRLDGFASPESVAAALLKVIETKEFPDEKDLSKNT